MLEGGGIGVKCLGAQEVMKTGERSAWASMVISPCPA